MAIIEASKISVGKSNMIRWIIADTSVCSAAINSSPRKHSIEKWAHGRLSNPIFFRMMKMSYNAHRYREWRREIDALRKAVPAEEFALRLSQKLVDWMDRNYYRINDIDVKEEIRTLFGPEWKQYRLDSVIKSYSTVIDTANGLYSDLGGSIGRDTERIRRIEKVNDIQWGRYEAHHIVDITGKVRQGLADGMNVKQLQHLLQQTASKKVKFYALTLAQTQIKSYSRVTKAEKSLSADVLWSWYVGSYRENKIRQFCRYELEYAMSKPRKISEIRALRNYNLEPVLYHCGGWNCVHDWEPDPTYKEGR